MLVTEKNGLNKNTGLHLITNLGSKFQVVFEEDTPDNHSIPDVISNTPLCPDILADIEQKICLPISSD